jgi:regulation of enolase protein 1 (concanavalin A-like superfamily)
MKNILLFIGILINVNGLFGQPSTKKIRLSSIPFELSIINNSTSIKTDGDSVLELTSAGKTNLFVNPNNKYNVQNAPMVLFKPDSSFVFTAKISAELSEIYDVAALVIYQDSNYWAKFCYENSVNKQPTIVSVVTRKFSDDCNSLTINKKFAFLAIIKNGKEIAFHYSTDGKSWELIRQFRLETENNINIGFAIHCSRGNGFSAKFSNIRYKSKVPDNLRTF